MGKLPNNIVRYDLVKRKHNAQKSCRCVNPTYLVDCENHTVECEDCGAIIDPFQALLGVAKQREREESYLETRLEQRRAIDSYKPHLIVLKELEKHYGQGNRRMMPHCPKCNEAFNLEDLIHGLWTSKEYYDKLHSRG